MQIRSTCKLGVKNYNNQQSRDQYEDQEILQGIPSTKDVNKNASKQTDTITKASSTETRSTPSEVAQLQDQREDDVILFLSESEEREFTSTMTGKLQTVLGT